LNLGFLVDREHDRFLWRRQIQAHDVADLGLQLRVGRELERLPSPRLQAPLAPDPSDPHIRDPAQVIGKQPARPVRHAQLLRRRLQRREHDRDLVDLSWSTRFGPVAQPSHAFGGIALLPRDHCRLRDSDPVHDLIRAHTFISQQHDPRPLRQTRRQRRRPHPSAQLGTIFGRHGHIDSQRHTPRYREVKLFHSRDTRQLMVTENVGRGESSCSCSGAS
jgi:hypothetical protein